MRHFGRTPNRALHRCVLGSCALLASWQSVCTATDRTWNNGGGGDGLWNNNLNWTGTQLPQSGDRALFTNPTVSGPNTIQIHKAGVGDEANAATIIFGRPASIYDHLHAGTSVATINYSGASVCGFELNMVGQDGNSSGFDFLIGDDRTSTSGIIHTNISTELAIKVRDGQALRYFSTITGTGSISLQTIPITGQDHGGGGLVLGAGDQSADGVLDTNNTFSGGFFLKSGILESDGNHLDCGEEPRSAQWNDRHRDGCRI